MHAGPSQSRCRMCDGAAPRPAGRVGGYAFVRCSRCAFVFAPAITRERMEALYGRGYHGPDDGAPEAGWADPSFLDPALRRLPGDRPLRILDFGAGQSTVPDRLRQRGHRVVAIDLVPPLRPHPDRVTGDLRALDLEPNGFDLAYSFQVFEHLPEPRPFLFELIRITRPGGLVLVHTDMEMPERRAGLAEWWYVDPPDHCSFFRHRTFETVLRGRAARIVYREPKAVVIRVGGSRPGSA